MRLRDFSIEQKLFLLILPICLIPALVFVVMFGLGAQATFEETMGTELTGRAKFYAERFDQVLLRNLDLLRQTVQTGAEAGAEAIAGEAQARLHVDSVFVISQDGRVTSLGSVPNRFPDLNAAFHDRFEFWWMMRDHFPAEGLIEEFRISVPGRVGPLTLLACILPVLKNETDTPREMMCFVFDSSQVVERFRQSTADIPSDFMVFTHSGALVHAPEGLEDLVEQTSAQLRTADGVDGYFVVHRRGHPYLSAFTQSAAMKHLSVPDSPSGPWRFLLNYDMQYFLAPHEERIWLSVLIALGLVLALLALASLTGRVLVRPLRQLRTQADRFAQGDLDVRAEVAGHDEIGDLAQSFNLMAGRLRETYLNLEDRIEESRLRADHINAINVITSAIIQSRSLDDIFHILHHEIGKILAFDAIWLSIQVRTGPHLQVMHIEPPGLISLFDRGRLPLEGSLHGQVAESLHTMHAEPTADDTSFEGGIARAEGLRSFLIAPMPARDRMIGTLTVASSDRGVYDDNLAEIIGSLARAVAISIEQAELFQRISQFAVELERKVADRTKELEQATRKLIQTEKYVATGRMAGNLAHEINNPLGIIKNYLQMVRNDLRKAAGERNQAEPSLEHLEIIDDEVNRIATMVNQLLSLHRPVEHKVRPVDINESIDYVLKLMDPGLKRSQISVSVELAQDLPCPIASTDLIRQILINLVRNAQDAMEPHGGQLLIRTSEIGEWDGNDYSQSVRIRVSDTGCGIDPENLSRIFDPFFSTKPQEKGSGLGLCVSYSIVRMYGGSIDVESTPGVGTTMVVTLPVVYRYEQAARIDSPRPLTELEMENFAGAEIPASDTEGPQKD